MEFKHNYKYNLDLLQADGFTDSKAVHCFSTRCGGVSKGFLSSLNLGIGRGDDLNNVIENYRLWCGAIGADYTKTVFSHQVHLDNIRICTEQDAGKGLFKERNYDADGLITNVVNLPLVIFSADCIPILLYDPIEKAIGACHAGWRGTAMNIAGKTVQKMSETYGCKPENIRCAIGAGISRCCFETHNDVPDKMREVLGENAERFIDVLDNGKFKVDLKAINAFWLEKSGVLPKKIVVSADCTSCKNDIYWSHRHTGFKRGSMAALIQLTD